MRLKFGFFISGIFSLAVTTSAHAAVSPKEIFALSWSTPTYSSGSGAHIYPMTRFGVGAGYDTPTTTALSASQSPIGRRGLLLLYSQRSILGNTGDTCIDPATNSATQSQCPYFNNGISATQSGFQSFFADYKAAGGSVDFLVLDSEIGLSNWQLGTSTQPYDAIESDARYGTNTYNSLINMATAAGLPSLTFQPLSKIGTNYSNRDEIGVWNELMGERINDAVISSVAGPLLSFFPAAKMSDYDQFWHHPSVPMYDPNGWPVAQFGTGEAVGTHAAPSLYGDIGNFHYGSLNPTGQEYAPTSFNGFRMDVNKMRGVVLGTSTQLNIAIANVKTSPWVAYRGFHGPTSTYSNSNYYQESVIHAVLAGADHLLFWNPTAQDKASTDDQTLSDVLAEMNGLVGYSDRKTLVTGLASWTSKFIITTTYANGKKVSRLTASEGDQIICTTNAQKLLSCNMGSSGVVNFPLGVKTQYGKLNVSSAGIWVVQPNTAMNPY